VAFAKSRKSEVVREAGQDADVAIPNRVFLNEMLNESSNHDGLLSL
jgi:hypothetical protein